MLMKRGFAIGFGFKNKDSSIHKNGDDFKTRYKTENIFPISHVEGFKYFS